MADDELARTMAAVQHRHQQAAEQIAEGDIRTADYHLTQAFIVLGDYKYDGEWSVEVADR